MNVWEWTYEMGDHLRESGYERLADYMHQISNDAVNNRHELLDQYVDEGVAMAREAGQPWVEILLRHWRLQSMVSIRQRPKHMIKEAVSLLEFAHRPGNIECPQSVCVTQDLCLSYNGLDAPAFTDECIHVCDEALARINPDWACFRCIVVEKARAYYHAGDLEECVQILDWADKERIERGYPRFTCTPLLFRARCFARMGQFDKARKAVSVAYGPGQGSVFLVKKRMTGALVEALAGDYAAAIKKVPPQKDFEAIGIACIEFAEVIWLVHQAEPAQVSKVRLRTLQQVAAEAEERGAYRDALTMNGWLCQILRGRRAEDDAQACLAAMERILPHLTKDLGAKAWIAELKGATTEA